MKENQTPTLFDRLSFSVDIIMVLLVVANINFILFDWLFEALTVQQLLQAYVPLFYEFYLPVHENFLLFDLIFVYLFLAELFVRWGGAIYQKEHEQWWWYPFAKWYDVLGCIPISSFRVLRFLRVVSMTLRLHKRGYIDIRSWYLFKVVQKYLNILSEEVTDRVVINILSGVQTELDSGSPVTERILTEIVTPHKDELVSWLSHRVRKALDANYAVYKDDLKAYINETIEQAVHNNRELSKLELIPVIGGTLTQTLQESISDIVFQVVHKLSTDLASDRNDAVVREVTDVVFDSVLLQEDDHQLDAIIKRMIHQSLDVIKAQVAIKQWQQTPELVPVHS